MAIGKPDITSILETVWGNCLGSDSPAACNDPPCANVRRTTDHPDGHGHPQVVEKGLDSQTAFAIVSIDIADIDVGANIGAKLQMDQAEADIRIARARAEKRRAMAVAQEQEMVALTRENQAAVVLAEAQIPSAMADAFRKGNLRRQGGPVSLLHPSVPDFPKISHMVPQVG